jgi:hypothetical protein
MPKLWQFRDSATGATVEEPPENPWLRRPEGIAEQLQHAEAMREVRRQLVDELLATCRFIDLKPPTREAERLQRLYAADKTAPSSEALLREVAQACARMRDYTWPRILDRLEREHRERAGADEAELAAIANSQSEAQPQSGGVMTMVRDALRRDGREGDK